MYQKFSKYYYIKYFKNNNLKDKKFNTKTLKKIKLKIFY